jgi:hypothetical protein
VGVTEGVGEPEIPEVPEVLFRIFCSEVLFRIVAVAGSSVGRGAWVEVLEVGRVGLGWGVTLASGAAVNGAVGVEVESALV